MKYCTNCGNKLKNEENFCSKCGRKLKKEQDVQKIILMLGIFLVLFSSFILGIISWDNMNQIYKIIFLLFETCLFFVLSFVLKKINSKLDRFFFIIGLILIPYTLSLIPYYKLLPAYFNNGAGLSIYLAILYFIIFLLYIFTNISLKSKFINYLIIISSLISVLNIPYIFTDEIFYIVLTISCYITILNLLSIFIKKDIKNALSISSAVLLILIIPFIIISFYEVTNLVNSIINSISFVLYLLNTYLRFKNKNTAFSVIAPFTISLITYTFIGNIIDNGFVNNIDSVNNYMLIYIIAIISILLYYISIIFNNKIFSTITLVISYLTLVSIILYSFDLSNYLILLIISIITLLFNISLTLIFKFKFFNYLIPLNIFLIIIAIIRYFTELKLIYVLLVTSLVFLFVYTILKLLKNKHSFTYLLSSYILAFLSIIEMHVDIFDYINIAIIGVLSLIFVLTIIFNENIAIRIISYITLNLVSLFTYINLSHGLYYSLLIISGVTLISCLLLSKTKKISLKPYILYSEILVFLISLFNNMNYNTYILFINIFIYVISYISVLKYFNVKWYRIIYIMLGFLTIIRIINILFVPIVISSIISILIILIILTIMYLLDIENGVTIGILSLILLYPYYRLINFINLNTSELYLLPIILYDIVFTTVIKFKDEENRKLWTIIPISILCYFFITMSGGVEAIIIDSVLALIFIILGLTRKYNFLIYFGIIFILIRIFISLFTVLNSIAIVIALIIIGFILIGVALFNELKKKK